jgi:hypothetical protein
MPAPCATVSEGKGNKDESGQARSRPPAPLPHLARARTCGTNCTQAPVAPVDLSAQECGCGRLASRICCHDVLLPSAVPPLPLASLPFPSDFLF